MPPPRVELAADLVELRPQVRDDVGRLALGVVAGGDQRDVLDRPPVLAGRRAEHALDPVDAGEAVPQALQGSRVLLRVGLAHDDGGDGLPLLEPGGLLLRARRLGLGGQEGGLVVRGDLGDLAERRPANPHRRQPHEHEGEREADTHERRRSAGAARPAGVVLDLSPSRRVAVSVQVHTGGAHLSDHTTTLPR